MSTIVATGTSGKTGRATLVARLRRRDGDFCQYPGCERSLDFSLQSGPSEVTIDHWMPQYYGKANHWSPDEIWDESNLKLMHKKCNAAKGDRIPNEDGSLPPRPTKTFRYRRDKRAQRAELCTACEAGRNLGPDEWCNACGHGPQPGRYPKWRQMSVKDCEHDLFYCVACTIWFPEYRRSAIDSLLTGGNGYE